LSEAGQAGRPRILLIVSLCLNVALVALCAAMFFRIGMRPFEPHGPKGGLSAPALIRMVPAEEAKIRAVLEAHRPKLHQLHRDAMQARAELFQALSAPAFDSQAFAKASTDVESADAALEAESLKITNEAVSVLTPEERARVAADVHKPGRAWLKRLVRKH